MEIYQVQTMKGNPAKIAGNESAIFLCFEAAKKHIDYLRELGLNGNYVIVDLNKPHYFAVSDERGVVAGIIKAYTNQGLRTALKKLTEDHYVVDLATTEDDVYINNCAGKTKKVKVRCIEEDEKTIFHEVIVKACELYKEE